MRVSIIIPLYNKGAYISETLDSVVRQTFDDFECLVLNNGSTDHGRKLVEEFSDPRIHLSDFNDRRGPGATRNEGLRRAQGEWILFLDADDLIEASHLERLLAVADRDPEADVIAGNWIEQTPDLTAPVVRHATPLGILPDSSIAITPWAVHAAIIQRQVTPLWPEELDTLPGEDIAFWHHAISGKRIACASSCGAIYRYQTPHCRTRKDDVETWYPGIHAAIQYNLRLTTEPTPGQSETLVRVYQDLYAQAARANHREIMAQALSEAEKWLAYRCQLPTPVTRGIRLRNTFGIPLHHRLKSLIRPLVPG